MGSIKPMIAVPYRASTFGVEVQLAPMYLPEETTLDSLIHVFFYAMRIASFPNSRRLRTRPIA